MAFPGDDDDSFSPSNRRLVDCYLCDKMKGNLSDHAKAAYFLDADVCSARPEELVRAHSTPARVSTRDAGDGQQFYFFSPARFVGTSKRRSRTIDGTGEKESWHAEGRPKPIEFSAAAGYVTKLSYHVRNGPKTVEKPGWIMAEYSFKDTGAGDLVLCKIYKSPRGAGRSASSSSSCTSSVKSGCKRKATDDLEEATSIRRPCQQTNFEENDAMLFAEDLEHDLMSVEDGGAVQEQDDAMLFAGDLEHDLMSSRRTRQTSQEEDDAMLFAGDLEHHLMSVEETTIEAAPKIGEMQSMEQSQPEPQVEELQGTMMAEEDGDGMTLLIPDGGDPEAYFMGLLFGNSKPQDIDELFLHGPSCPHPGGNLDLPCA